MANGALQWVKEFKWSEALASLERQEGSQEEDVKYRLWIIAYYTQQHTQDLDYFLALVAQDMEHNSDDDIRVKEEM
ncbi:hypothetical protein BGZ65_001000 [Modicella reniformis]|uniref:Uncharacterized protein n=1 Tax=Modicella reniformis TaxID=1440133 RepID=A0A9P6LSH3_9FUNG|nr:hypothetical protein BGZ65_001000 [Modicella reniformis]